MANSNSRKFSSYATKHTKAILDSLIDRDTSPLDYQKCMISLGIELGKILANKTSHSDQNLLVSTAEDTDFLAKGVAESLSRKEIQVKQVVFWNNHHQVKDSNTSVAPIINSYYEQGFNKSSTLIIVKSIVSGSCVIKTNILALIEDLNIQEIYIVSPVIHRESINKLKTSFPAYVSDKFRFIYFAIDSIRLDNGEVEPGIGGQIYERLGLAGQPFKIGYIPKLVQKAITATTIQ